jgi:hypothetical protein
MPVAAFRANGRRSYRVHTGTEDAKGAWARLANPATPVSVRWLPVLVPQPIRNPYAGLRNRVAFPILGRSYYPQKERPRTMKAQSSTRALFLACVVSGALVVMTGCVTDIKPSTSQNPAPAENFSAFNRFEVTPLKSANSEVAAYQDALARIQENIDDGLKSRLDRWNAKPLDTPARTLLIEPVITDLKFVGGGQRFVAGAFAGSSAVVMRARFLDKEGGKVLAYPEFYAHAAAMGGAFSVGGTDNATLVRIANSLAVYVFSNYRQAVGGPVMPTETEADSIATD